MVPNARHLALRDTAFLALAGAIPSTFGAEPVPQYAPARSPYEARNSFGADYGVDFGSDSYGYGADFGADFGADPLGAMAGVAALHPALAHAPGHPAARAPSNAQAHAAHAHMMRKHAGTQRRLGLLNPNKDSDIDVEAYLFSLNPSQFATGSGLTWGTANGWTAFKNPQVAFRAERIFINVKIPGLVYVNTVQAANVNAQIGAVADGFTFSVYAMGSKISLPTLPPQNTMQVTGTWSNVVDSPYIAGQSFALAIDFEGWATVTPK